MNPDQWYQNDELLSPSARKRIWRMISDATLGNRRALFTISDARSFYYGMAASVALLLSVYGVFGLFDRLASADRPIEIRFDEAYRSAIREFENVLPAPKPVGAGATDRDMLEARRQHLRLLDHAISELRDDIARTDLSPLKRTRLRQLYALKLQALLEMIEQGDIEL